jgi:hypothetical protein
VRRQRGRETAPGGEPIGGLVLLLSRHTDQDARWAADHVHRPLLWLLDDDEKGVHTVHPWG